MKESRTQTPPDEDELHEMACPFRLLMKTVSKTTRKHSAFFNHLMNAQIELLQAFKSVIDQQISCLEDKKKNMGDTKKATKIEVE
jgi:hypothetical protein